MGEILTIILRCHGAAILLTDQRDGSESMKRLDVGLSATKGDPFSRGWERYCIQSWLGGIVR